MSFSFIDIIFAIIVLVTTINGFAKGFIENCLNKLGWILAVIISALFYEKVGIQLSKYIPNDFVSKIAGFILIFIVVFLIIMILKVILSKIFSGEILGGLNRGLGGVFGIVEGIAISFIIIFILQVQPFFDITSVFNGSFFASLMNSVTSQF